MKARIAANAKRSVGIEIVASGSGLDDKRKILVKRWNRKKGFRHPVYGNRENWVAQEGRQYFGKVIIEHRKDARVHVLAAMREAEKSLEGTP